jgi:hypothetical protein
LNPAETKPPEHLFAIVFLGSFNPPIFHPLWFAGNNMVAREVADNATDVTISKRVATFIIDNIRVQVDSNRFSLGTEDDARSMVLRDWALGTISILEQTPIISMGFNLDSTYTMDNEDNWHALGNYLAPKDFWKEVVDKPGMRHLVIEGTRPNCSAEMVRLQVQSLSSPRVIVRCNQHYQLDKNEKPPSDRIEMAKTVITRDWIPFLDYAKETEDKIVRSATRA